MSKWNVRALFALKALVSVVLVWLILRNFDFHSILERFRDLDWFKAGLVLVCAFFCIGLAGLRWHILADGILPLWPAVKYTWIGAFFGALLPGAISGDIAKGTSLALKNVRMRVFDLPLSILIDRAVGFFGLLLFFNVGCALMAWGGFLPLPEFQTWAANAFLLGAGATAAILLLVTRPMRKLALAILSLVPILRLRMALERTLEAVFRYLGRPQLLLKGLLVSCAIHGLNVLQYVLVAQALHFEISFPLAAAFYSILSLILTVPVSISGVGVREWVMVVFFGAVGIDGDTAVAFSWLQLVGSLIVASGGGFVQVWEMFMGHRPEDIERVAAESAAVHTED